MFAATSLDGPAPASMKRKTLLPARCKQVVPRVQPFALRLFRERTAFLSAEAGKILLLRVEMKFHHLALSRHRTLQPTCASSWLRLRRRETPSHPGIRLSMLQRGSLVAEISIKDLLFGISNLEARRYAIGTEQCGYCNEIFSNSPHRFCGGNRCSGGNVGSASRLECRRSAERR